MDTPSQLADRPGRTGPVVTILLGVVLVALNLRVAVNSLGPLLAEVRQGVGLSPAIAGVVTMLPTLSFAVAGSTAPWLVRRFRPARILVVAMALLAGGQLLRAMADSAVIFLVCSGLALAGIAVANVLLPALVKEYFPARVGLLTGVYTMSLVLGATAAAAASVPIAELAGTWRVGIGGWAVLAVVAAVPWLPAALRRAGYAERAPVDLDQPRPVRVRVGRTRLGWAMALFFGTQSLAAYAFMGWLAQLFRDAGFSSARAGLLLAAITAFAVPVALLTPALAGRMTDLRAVVLGLSALVGFAYVGLAVAPGTATMLWVVALAIGQGSFPLALAMIGLRARTAEGTVALSAFTQGTGYLLAGLGPLLVGVLYGVTGGWLAPLGFLMAVNIVQALAGLAVARPQFVEDG